MANMTFKTNLLPNLDYTDESGGYSLGSIEDSSNPKRWRINGKIPATNIFYGTCTTAAGTAAKTCTNCIGFTADSLVAGTVIMIKFTAANSAANPTLNINNTGAQSLMQYGTTALAGTAATTGWQAGAVVMFIYDGTNWIRDQAYNTVNSNNRDPGYGKITPQQSAAETAITPNTTQLVSTTYTEVMTVAAGNKWVQLAGSNGGNGTDVLTVGHSLSGVTVGNYGDSTAQTPGYGGTFNVPYISVDAAGHVSGISAHTVTIPAIYSHPTSPGNKHIPSGGATGQHLIYGGSSGTAEWANIPVTSVASKTGEVTLGTLTVGSKTYNGSGDTTIEIADLGLASTTTFLGITSTNLSNGSTTSPVNIVIGPTTGNVTPSNGSVVMEQDSGEEYIWTGDKWNLMGLASSWALANHIHGNILNNGTITSDTAVATNQHLVITDSNNKISRSALSFSSNQTQFLRHDGSWAVPAGDHKVTQGAAITTAGAYPIILATSTATTEQTNTVNKTSTLTYNPDTTKLHTPILEVTASSYGETLPSSGTAGQLFFQTSAEYYELPVGGATGRLLMKRSTADRDVSWTNNVYVSNDILFGAAWNDYAEYRECLSNEYPKAGNCVIETGEDSLQLSTQRMQPGAEIVSDTFGFAIGKTNKATLPIAVSGRVLAYTYENREEFRKNIGKPVCSGPNGTVSIMTDEEYRNYGYCAIGTVSSVPNYKFWGENNIKVDNRVWIKVR